MDKQLLCSTAVTLLHNCIENSCNYILSLYYLYSYVHFVLFEFNDGDWFELPLDYLMSIFKMSIGYK